MVKTRSVIPLLLLLSTTMAARLSHAATYYVSSGQVFGNAANVPAAGVNNRNTNIAGSGKNRGSIEYPFLTIQYAAKQVLAGDTVIVRDGLYNESVSFGLNASNVRTTSQSGTSAAPISVAAEHTGLAYIRATGTYDGCFNIRGAGNQTDIGWANITVPMNYINIRGFDLACSGHEGSGLAAIWAHHISISDCVIHDSNGGGISAIYSDYITISGNRIFNNCRTSSYNGSGISLLTIRPYDQIQTPGVYHNVIQHNTVYNNYIAPGTYNVFLDKDGTYHLIHHTDGNGIIIDTSSLNVSELIEGNLVYNNGGRGIINDGSSNVDILNNTCYNNCIDPEVGGTQEMLCLKVTWASAAENTICQNVNMRDNICWPGNGKHAISIDSTSLNINVTNNWLYSASGNTGSGKASSTLINYNTLGGTWNISGNYGSGLSNAGGNPLFVNPGITETANFRLQATSPCKDKSISHPANDIDNFARPYGAGYDLGAFEYHPAPLTTTLGGYRYQRSNGHYFQPVTLLAANGAVAGPISLVLDNLTDASLVGATGATWVTSPMGSPYVSTAGLSSGASSTLMLEFTGRPNAYTLRILVGSEAR